MGISSVILLCFLSAIITMMIGFIIKSKPLKIASTVLFIVAIGVFLVLWRLLKLM